MNPSRSFLTIAGRLFGAILLATIGTYAPAEDDLLAGEGLGALKLGMEAKEMSAALGHPTFAKGKQELEGATGEYVETWTSDDAGLSIRLSSGEKPGGTKRIVAITATGKCTLGTKKGIRIGSKRSDVEKAYGSVEDKENRSENSFVAGSIYGGIIFTIEKNEVKEIFIGAAAE